VGLGFLSAEARLWHVAVLRLWQDTRYHLHITYLHYITYMNNINITIVFRLRCATWSTVAFWVTCAELVLLHI